MTDVSYAPTRAHSRHHLHRWEAHLTDDRWHCACGAECFELVDLTGKTILLPIDRLPA